MGFGRLFCKRSDKLGNQIGREQPILETGKDPVLNLLPPNGPGVIADSFAAACRASVAVLCHDRIGAATAAAGEQPTQQKLAPMSAIERMPASSSTNTRSPAVCTWRSIGFSRPVNSRYSSQSQE